MTQEVDKCAICGEDILDEHSFSVAGPRRSEGEEGTQYMHNSCLMDGVSPSGRKVEW